MITPTPNNEDVEAFKTLFSGYTGAHGTFEVRATDPQTGKKSGKAPDYRGSASNQRVAGAFSGSAERYRYDSPS